MLRKITAAAIIFALGAAVSACHWPATPPNFKKEPAIAPPK